MDRAPNGLFDVGGDFNFILLGEARISFLAPPITLAIDDVGAQQFVPLVPDLTELVQDTPTRRGMCSGRLSTACRTDRMYTSMLPDSLQQRRPITSTWPCIARRSFPSDHMPVLSRIPAVRSRPQVLDIPHMGCIAT